MTDTGPFWSVTVTRDAHQQWFDCRNEESARRLYGFLRELGVMSAHLVRNDTQFSQDEVVEPT